MQTNHDLATLEFHLTQAKDVSRYPNQRLLSALYAAKTLGRIEQKRYSDPNIKDISPYLAEHAETLNSIYDALGDLI